MEQNDDFEMKPLTPGLGFHKRQMSLKEHMLKTGVASRSIKRSLPSDPVQLEGAVPPPRTSKEIIDELHQALTPEPKVNKKSGIALTEILPREIGDLKENRRERPEISPVENINFHLPNEQINESGPRRGASDNLVNPLTPVAVNFSSLLLDTLIVLTLSLIFILSLVMVTGVDLLSVVRSSQTEFATQLSLIVLYVTVFEMYVIVARSFFGRTIAEWTFDLQMGDDELIAKTKYPVLVLWRSLVILLTGVFLLPILSLLTGRDLAARFTGLQLYKKNI